MDFLSQLPPILQAFLGGLFTWGFTMLGSAVVFAGRELGRKWLDASLGFSAGIMISASFFSLILPALEIANTSGVPTWVPVASGFLMGGLFLKLIDSIIPHLHIFMPMEKAEGVKSRLSKTWLLILAMTIHNFPEGMAVGVAFGSVGLFPKATLAGALALTLGIAIQNFPEGSAISLPLRREGFSPFKSFFIGQLSAVVEPLGALIGAGLVGISSKLLPYTLSFAAGAMIYVVVEELIPEAESGENVDLATISALLGFVLMMVLDVAFG